MLHLVCLLFSVLGRGLWGFGALGDDICAFTSFWKLVTLVLQLSLHLPSKRAAGTRGMILHWGLMKEGQAVVYDIGNRKILA